MQPNEEQRLHPDVNNEIDYYCLSDYIIIIILNVLYATYVDRFQKITKEKFNQTSLYAKIKYNNIFKYSIS